MKLRYEVLKHKYLWKTDISSNLHTLWIQKKICNMLIMSVFSARNCWMLAYNKFIFVQYQQFNISRTYMYFKNYILFNTNDKQSFDRVHCNFFLLCALTSRWVSTNSALAFICLFLLILLYTYRYGKYQQITLIY